jgi:F-type H+-transporting ATPase subunit epsilon
MTLGVYTIEKTLFEGDIKELVVKTETGEIAVLPNHIPLISRLVEAPLKIIDAQDKEKIIPIKAGFLEVKPESNIVILVDAL